MRHYSYLAPLLAMGCFGNPLRTRQNEIIQEGIVHLDKIIPEDTPRGQCLENDFSTRKSAEDIWKQSGAGKILDAYLGSGVEYYAWPQRLYMSIFPKGNPADFSCLQSEDKCDLIMQCENFEKAGWPGAYYIFLSLDNFNKFLNQFQREFDYLRVDMITDVPSLIRDLKVSEHLKLKEKMSILDLMPTIFGIGSEISSSNPLASQFMSITGSLTELAVDKLHSKDEGRDINDVTVDVQNMMKDTMNVYYNWISMMRLDMYGGMNPDETKNPSKDMLPDLTPHPERLPRSMTHPNSGGLPGPSQVLSMGKWMVNHPTDIILHRFGAVKKMLDQALAFQILRIAYGATVIISKTEGSRENCGWKNGFWYEPSKECWVLVKRNHEGRLFGGEREFTEAHFLWDTCEMDQETVLGNIINCWVSQPEAQIKPAPWLNEPFSETYPYCFFSTEVKKGKWTEAEGEFAVLLEDGFPQYSKEVLDWKPHLSYYEWPENYRGYN